jgi:DNA-binding LacI/PurR family transcriptional regulator
LSYHGSRHPICRDLANGTGTLLNARFMARPKSQRILQIKAKLIARIRDGFHQPGEPFLSNRALAERYGVSYQTAHRLLNELVSAGWLNRQPSAGTFIAGAATPMTEAQLLFHPRARQLGSFGASLSRRLLSELAKRGIRASLGHTDEAIDLKPDRYPIVWEIPALVERFAAERRYALVLHDSPPSGIGASYVDAIQTDDLSGGVVAAEMILEHQPRVASFLILGGPIEDARCQRRVEGFRRVLPGSPVVHARGWFREDGLAAADEVLTRNPAAVFCCNDRLAEGLLTACAQRRIPPPGVIGYDNAPIAEALNLTTIAIPWDLYVRETVELVRRRLAGDTSPARQVVLSLRPHRRLSF